MDFLTKAYISIRSKLIAGARSALTDPEAAEDVLQDVFYRLWIRKYRPANQKEAESLIARSVHNAVIDEYRHKRQKVPLHEQYLTECPRYDRTDILRNVEKIICSELTETQQLIVRRKEYEDCSVSDIAQELGMNETAVRMQLSRARKKIREIYNRL